MPALKQVVLISSTSKDLGPYRAAAHDVVADLGFYSEMMEHFGADARRSVLDVCREKVAGSDLVVIILAFRRGWVPESARGGDDVTSITEWEVRAAVSENKDYLVFQANENTWPGALWEHQQADREAQIAFRKNIDRTVAFFDWESDLKLPAFRALLRQELTRWWKEIEPGEAKVAREARTQIVLRQPAEQEWPERPYPLLLPYEHPALFFGRGHEIDKLRELVSLRILILGLFATSGAGKSSLLEAGLIPRLRKDGFRVARDRTPAEGRSAGSNRGASPGLLGRLLGDLFEGGETSAEEDLPGFVEGLAAVRRASSRPPVLILDQLEDIFQPEAQEQRANIARVLTATAPRWPEWDDAVCRWVLVYRHEFHGRVSSWLASLEPDLAQADRFHWWELPPFGQRGTSAATTEAFLEAIEGPLKLTKDDGSPRYGFEFVDGHAQRLAQAFSRARIEHPEDPLMPELQVVLSSLMASASETDGGPRLLHVPEDARALVTEALTQHLRAALAFVSAVVPKRRDEHRFLLLSALSRLVTDEGRRGPALGAAELAAGLGEVGMKELEALADARWRILLARPTDGDVTAYELAHDCLAEAVLTESRKVARSDLADLARLAELVRRRVKDFEEGLRSPATRLRWADYRSLARLPGLRSSELARQWWDAVRQARLLRFFFAAGTAMMIVGFFWLVRIGIDRYSMVRRLDNIAGPQGLEALASLGHLWWWEVKEVTEDGEAEAIAKNFYDVDPEWSEALRAEIVYRGVRAASPLLLKSKEEWIKVDFKPLGSALWLLDRYPIRQPEWKDKALALRKKFLAPLGQPPEIPASEWKDVPGSKNFRVTRELGEGEGYLVDIAPFQMSRKEVTNELYQKLVPGYGDRPFPVTGVSWEAAYVFSAWLGGRLPEYKELEYAWSIGKKMESLPVEELGENHATENEGRFQGMYDSLGEWVTDCKWPTFTLGDVFAFGNITICRDSVPPPPAGSFGMSFRIVMLRSDEPTQMKDF